jgi:hypothetical protein
VEQLIELISKNFMLVMFLLWAVFGLFKRKGTEPMEKPGRGQRPEQRQDIESANKPWEHIEEEELRTTSIDRERPRVTDPIRAYENLIQQPLAKATQEIKQNTAKTKFPQQTQVNNNEQTVEDIYRPVDFKKISSTNVVQGIIWSQVLGKPRSKEPHRTFRRGRYN